MNSAPPDSLRRAARLATPLAALAAVFLLAGCEDIQVPQVEFPGTYHPTNYWRFTATMPAKMKRVALLPLTTATSSDMLDAGVEAMQPIVHSELEKLSRFEVIPVPADLLRQLTGRPGWSANQLLPLNFFEKLHQSTGCDGVMFCQLTRYQPYQPLAIGWKLTLVAKGLNDNSQPQILWSVDEILDAGDPAVANTAEHYNSQHIHGESPMNDPSTILRSPQRYGQFSLAVLFSTMPNREGGTSTARKGQANAKPAVDDGVWPSR